MKIAVVSTLSGGVGRSTSRLTKGVLASDPKISADLFLVDSRIQYDIRSLERVTMKYSPRTKSPIVSKMLALIELSMKPFPYDLVHCHYASFAASLKRYRGRLLLTMRGFPRPEVESRIGDKLAYHYEHWCVKHLPENVHVVTISQYCKDVIESRYDVKTDVIYNGVDFDFFRPPVERDAVKRELGLEDKKVLLFTGRLHPIKDPFTLLSAFEIVAKKSPDAVLVMAGDGPLRTKIEEIASSNNLPVRLTGNVNDKLLRSYYQCSDVFVLPTLGEAFGNSLVEAMACGCACLSNTTGASPEILGTDKLLAEPSNPKDLADKMLWLLEHPSESRDIADKLRVRAAERFSLEREATSYYEKYKSLLN
ncbi:MAG TPA: glycosyltransferase family 4 protein [Nitrososphaera sp.]|jgi:glycosyltransferase involved in cell wall biosynthesis